MPPGPDPALAHAVELVPVEVPADLLVALVAPVDDHCVGVEGPLAPGQARSPLARPVFSWQGPKVPSGFFWRGCRSAASRTFCGSR